MVLSSSLVALVGAAGLGLVSASPMVPVLETRHAQHSTPLDAIQNLARSLNALRLHGRDSVFSTNKTTLDTSWNGAILFSSTGANTTETNKDKNGKAQGTLSTSAGVEIRCDTCYIKGTASASLTVKGNATEIFKSYVGNIKDAVDNVTDQAFAEVKAAGNQILANLADGINRKDFDIPPPKINFDLDLPPLPSVIVNFGFEPGFELFLKLGIKLNAAATYTLNLFSSNTPIGIAVGNDVLCGVAVVVDLILDVKGAIDVTSGFHLKIDKPLAFELAMFSKNASSLQFPGGQFEFLPVTLESANIVLKGVLRVNLKAGLEYNQPKPIVTIPEIDVPDFFIPDDPDGKLDAIDIKFGAGIVVSAFANIAEFTTNITVGTFSTDVNAPKPRCALEITNEYKFALGAAAGASIAVGPHTWGPTPNKSVDLFHTTFASACATVGKPTPQTAAFPTKRDLLARAANALAQVTGFLLPRQALTPVTLSSATTFTGIACASTGFVNCPASLQVTSRFSSILTHVTSVAAGVTPTFPAAQISGVANSIPFGDAAKAIAEAAPPAPTQPPKFDLPNVGDIGDKIGNKTNEALNDAKAWLEQSSSNKIVLGLAVGLGLPLLIIFIHSLITCCRRPRYDSVPSKVPPPPPPGQTVINVGAPPQVPPAMPYKQPLMAVSDHGSGNSRPGSNYRD